jgi:hypothetical protein
VIQDQARRGRQAPALVHCFPLHGPQ